MKGAVAAMIVAVEEFIKNNPHFPGSIGFLITSDEEGPALSGTKKVIETLQARQIKIDYCLIGEPSSITEVGAPNTRRPPRFAAWQINRTR